MHFIFPDSNIFLHGKYFEDIDWPSWLSCDSITLVLAPVVIAELDKHKFNPAGKISRRARKLLPRLEAILEESQTCKYNFQALLKKPAKSTFNKYQLDKKEQDDELLATILEFSSTVGHGDTVVLVTNDTGLRLKAKALGINASKLPEDYMQSPELDESEKQILALQQQLQQFKNRVPVIELSFKNERTFLTVKKPPKIKSKDEYVEQELTKIKQEFQPLTFMEDDKVVIPNLKTIRLPLFNLTEYQVNQYNEELSRFHQNCAAYFESQYDHFACRYDCTEISILVKNTGFVPATDLDVQFHFPNGFDIINEDDFPEIKKKPTPPYKPKHSLDIQPFAAGADLFAPIIGKSHFNPDLSQINTNVSSPDIKRTNSYDVSFHVKSVKHNQSVELDALYLKFPDIRKAKGFTIDYKIMAANIPKLITGQLHVKFE